MTTTSLFTRPGPAHQLLDSIIGNHLDRLKIKPGQVVLEVGAGPGEITARLAALVGRDGSVTAVTADTRQLAPTSVIDIYRRDLDCDLLPGTTDSYHLIVARWPHGPLRDPVDVVQQMIARLRPGGTLALAFITPTTPRIYRAPDAEDARLIGTVMHHARRVLVGPDGSATWTRDIDTLLLDNGMAGHCTHTGTETWTGGGPGCRLLADIVTHLRPTLTEITGRDIDRFGALMADPRVLLASYERQVIHARKPVC
ncbi:class I SAM-dependent methyltransferase [Micromonospora craniellae]|uniref:Class I SAM-dependent methyltransferase n=1 Tax=Micromonospora craniellae TaxID=2294034 RepID=A0A372FRD8_9ACTN|nr:class I SAM-dependent methyltransferase [Micromonospora craniellae]QOC93901.1 class I SAM-dependent methyltransferase [Micromonospora craniellae]RFS41042.1 class I SAM-dependent methyltransferase [Micromonospora craniellae]